MSEKFAGVDAGHHPYLPKDLLLNGYTPNKRSAAELLTIFAGALLFCFVLLWIYMRNKKHLQNCLVVKLKISWFLMCGLIHMILEGYFGTRYNSLASESTILAELWKEYSKADSRYISGDTFTVCMENITAFVDGPLAFLAVYAFLANKPNRYIVQLVLSVMQLYGDVLYFLTEVKEGFSHGPFGHPVYFWFYFVFINLLWIVIPFACVWESWRRLGDAQQCHDEASHRLKKSK